MLGLEILTPTLGYIAWPRNIDINIGIHSLLLKYKHPNLLKIIKGICSLPSKYLHHPTLPWKYQQQSVLKILIPTLVYIAWPGNIHLGCQYFKRQELFVVCNLASKYRH